jgi:hypothetical protein
MRAAILSLLQQSVSSVLRSLNIIIFFRTGSALGDQLCMTAYLPLLRQRASKIIVISSYPEFFINNKLLWKNIAARSVPKVIRSSFFVLLRALQSSQIIHFSFQGDEASFLTMLREGEGKRLIDIHGAHINEKLLPETATPQLFISPNELESARGRFHIFNDDYALLHLSGKERYTPNKRWSVQHAANLVQQTPSITWVQVGTLEDPRIEGTIDLRGKTSLRELIVITSRARFVLCEEGLLNHCAAATQRASVVIQSGFSVPSLGRYPTTTVITPSEKIACAPCALRTPCPLPSKICTEYITSEVVEPVVVALWDRYAK